MVSLQVPLSLDPYAHAIQTSRKRCFVMITIESAAATRRGRCRPDNQDRFFAGATCFAVADGVGGNAGGDVAAQTAVDVLWSGYNRGVPFDLAYEVRLANIEVHVLGREHPHLRCLATTMTAIEIIEDGREARLHVASVGDSRLYLFRGGCVTQLTEDDSFLRVFETHSGPRSRRVLTRALGLRPTVELHLDDFVLQDDDRLLLCTDGVTDALGIGDIRDIGADGESPRCVADRLVEAAVSAGGSDDATAIVVDVRFACGRPQEQPPSGLSRLRLLRAA